jgi:hypothetical protein
MQCSVEGCKRPNEARGYCKMHRWRVRYKGDPGQPGKLRPYTSAKEESVPCSVEGCGRPRTGKQLYCKLHYERVRRTGSLGPPQPLYQAKGNGHVTTQGYLRIHLADGRRIMEHVHVMEQHLGRRLEENENVHHRNGLRDDNRLENLELWVKVQPRGQRAEDLIRFVVEHYPAEVRRALEEIDGAAVHNGAG